MKTKILLFLLVIFSFSTIVYSQEIDDEENSDIAVPETAMQEVVRRILVYNFKPRIQTKVIFLSQKGINKNWLPEIKNIEFRLLTDEEIEDSGTDIYFFTKPELSNKTYEIDFAYGNPNCNYLGNIWRFRISKNRVRLWLTDGGIGGGCSETYGSPGDFKSPGKLNEFPNELDGYRFFNLGKLKGLKLTISTKEDVKNNLGDSCESSCDFDDKWKISFSYFGDFSYKTTVDDKETRFVAKDEFVDKLYSITLFPKSDILFNKIIFPPSFRQHTIGTAAHDGKGGGTNASYHIYRDRYGLEYSVLEKISLTTIKDLKWQKGELTSIKYKVPDKLREKMFVGENF